MSIELCLIVKDSGEKIVKALESWLPIINHWTILDTGSTDGTQDRIRKTLATIPGTLYEEPFTNFLFDCFNDEKSQKSIIDLFGVLPFDFAKARNRSLELCKKNCDYIITIDDTYIIINPQMLKQKLTKSVDKKYNAFLINIENNSIHLDENGNHLETKKEVTIQSLRIVRSSKVLKDITDPKSYKWVNSIHELLDSCGDVAISVTLDHDTYIYDEVDDYHNNRSTNRHKRDIHVLSICYDNTEEVKLKARYAYYAAQTSIILHDDALADKWLKRRLDLKVSHNQDLYCSMNQYARLTNNRKYAEQAIEMYPEKIEAYFEAAQIACSEQLYTAAYAYLRHGLLSFNQHDIMFHETYFDFLKLLIRLALRNGHHKDAVEYINKALAHSKTDEYINNSIEVCKSIGIWQEIKQEQKDSSYHEITVSTREKRRVVFINGPVSTGPWDGESTTVRGSETSILKLVPRLADKYEVIVFCETPYKDSKVINGVTWSHINNVISYMDNNDIDYMVCFRHSAYLRLMNKYIKTIRNHYFWTQDTGISGDSLCPSKIAFRKFIFLTNSHKNGFIEQFSLPDQLCEIIPNGIDVDYIKTLKQYNKIPNRFIYSSDANRGLYNLLKMFPIIKQRLPDATLHLYCDLQDTDANCFSGDYKAQCDRQLVEIRKIVHASDYIVSHGRTTKKELYAGFARAEYWFYPNTFVETFCITALEAQYFKCKVLCPALGALSEVVKSGVVYEPNTPNNKILEKLFDPLTDWKLESGYDWAMKHSYDQITKKWIAMFDEC
jgi:glycosyltransferase involved in cell wall biosynthesis